MEHTYDFYKPNRPSPHAEYPLVDGRLSIKCYMRALDACYARYCDKSAIPRPILNHFNHVCFHAPYAKLVRKAFARLVVFANIQSLTLAPERLPPLPPGSTVRPCTTTTTRRRRRFLSTNRTFLFESFRGRFPIQNCPYPASHPPTGQSVLCLTVRRTGIPSFERRFVGRPANRHVLVWVGLGV